MNLRMYCMVCHEMKVVCLIYKEDDVCPTDEVVDFVSRHRANDCVMRLIGGHEWIHVEPEG